jgi:CDGSH-type Zn-finger protein
MTQPICVQKSPFALELERGDHYWCACGRSKNQPFCDGSHSGTGLEPIKFTVTEKETKYLCGCRSSGNKPFCDGTHKEL